MPELNDVIHHIYPFGGGYHIRRTREPLTDVVCCVHCRGTGAEPEGRITGYLWAAERRCCVCRGMGYFSVPAEGMEPPPACY